MHTVCDIMTIEQIAKLLGTSEHSVNELWQQGALQKTEPRDGVEDLELHSSIYDLLEYMLWAGKLDVVLSKEQAALWVTNFVEIIEISSDLSLTPKETKTALLEYSIEDELCTPARENSEIASCIVESHEIIVAFREAYKTLCDLLSYVDRGSEISVARVDVIKSILNECRTMQGAVRA